MPAVTSPPRRRRRSDPFASGQAEPLHHELELALLFGRGCRGLPPVELQSVEDWRRVWGEYRELIAPKVREYLPGRRAFAAYVAGEFPPPPVVREPPLGSDYFRVWIAGTGRYWAAYPEPWQRNETAWLVELGEVDEAEHERYLEQLRRPPPSRPASGVWRLLRDYPLEAGRTTRGGEYAGR